VHIEHDLICAPDSALRVAAGTTITLEPNVSFLIKGRAEFLGTEAQPITIQRSNPGLPWGVIAVQGPGASGSKFEHVKFLGGGGELLEEVEYTGSICVHDAFNVTFDHCEIANNSRCDDGLHVDRGGRHGHQTVGSTTATRIRSTSTCRPPSSRTTGSSARATTVST